MLIEATNFSSIRKRGDTSDPHQNTIPFEGCKVMANPCHYAEVLDHHAEVYIAVESIVSEICASDNRGVVDQGTWEGSVLEN